MAVSYATVPQFTALYSVTGVSSQQLFDSWIPEGSLRVNEALGAFYSVPFSSDNHTARSLAIHYTYLGILERTRNQEDSGEIRKSIEARVTQLTTGGQPMWTDSGDALYPTQARNKAWSNTMNYKPVFDLRDSQEQRRDPDRLTDEVNADIG